MSQERDESAQSSPSPQRSPRQFPAGEEAYRLMTVDEFEEPDPSLNRITNAVIRAAIAVHRALGPGFPEAVYERAMIIELTRSGITFVSQARFELRYENQIVGDFRLDMVVEDAVVVEFKAVDMLAPIHRAQVISYLKATGYRLALLINFNVPLLKDGIRRIAM